MPLVSVVGRKSLKTRSFFLGVYLLLTVGAITMVYPFALMLSMSTCSRADYEDFSLVPEFWHDDGAMFKKIVVDAAPMDELSVWFSKDTWFSPLDIEPSDFDSLQAISYEQRAKTAADMREFVDEVCPKEYRMPLFSLQTDSPLYLANDYQEWLKSRYKSVEAANKAYRDTAEAWNELAMTQEQPNRQPQTDIRSREWREFIESRSAEKTNLANADRDVRRMITTVGAPKDFRGPRDAKGQPVVASLTYDDLLAGKLGSGTLDKFFENYAAARFVQVDTVEASSAWSAFLLKRDVRTGQKLTARQPVGQGEASLWAQFVQRECPRTALKLLRPEDNWREYLRAKYHTAEAVNEAHGTSYKNFNEARIPYGVFQYQNFIDRASEYRWKYFTYNFATSLSFITVHGNALLVTVIYIALSVIAALTVNPLAAYAMSRFRLKENYHILIFLLATMAFPGEVLMIPNFLLIKSFPVVPVIAAGLCLLGFYLLFAKLKLRLSPMISATIALLATAGMAGWVIPGLMRTAGVDTSVSLMNSYWALVLPGLANGYGIFLLKGFFDSLPPELYEAGLIDGASEMRMFRQITLPLCKPILAVLALGAFTAAYGAFMHAFLVCQDPKMWTLMVFLYEFQQNHNVPMSMSALVLAAVPTLVVFIFCQNIILRGIVIPTYK